MILSRQQHPGGKKEGLVSAARVFLTEAAVSLAVLAFSCQRKIHHQMLVLPAAILVTAADPEGD